MTEQTNLSFGLRARVALDKHGFRNAHALGQNFLLDDALLSGLLDAADIEPSDRLVEIGPGAGVMTGLMASRCRSVLAFEVDRKLQPVLEDVLVGLDNVQIVYQDFMKADLTGLVGEETFRVVANLPYYITADILLRLVTATKRPERIAIMVQREAAERLMSSPGAKQWCALAAMVQYYGQPRILADVPAEAFDPPPHVQSQFIAIERHDPPVVTPRDEPTFFRLVSAAFAMRRKTMENNLIATFRVSRDQARQWLDACGIESGARGETLSLADFAHLADRIG